MTAFKEEVLIDITLEKADNDKQVDNLTKKLSTLKRTNEELIKTNKELSKQGQENSKAYLDNAKQIEINKQKITENTASRKGLVQAIVAEDNSIKGLKVRNAELIKQRDLLNTETEQGRKRVQEINAELDKNNEKIRENSSSLEKQKINIGNYASALDGIVPGLSGFVSGIETSTVAAKAFIATPLGLILGGIALALAPVVTFLTQTADGMDLVDVETSKWKATLRVLKLELADVGKEILGLGDGEPSALGKFIKQLVVSNPIVFNLIGTLKLLGAVFPETTAKINQARAVAEAYAKAIDDINEREQVFSLSVKATANEIDKLILQSRDRTKTEAQRIALAEEADKLIQEQVRQETGFSKERLNQEIETAKQITGLRTQAGETQLQFVERLVAGLQKIDEEQSKTLTDAFIRVQEAEGSSIKILEKLQNQRNALFEKQEEESKKRREQELKELQEFADEIAKINKEVVDRTIAAENGLEEVRLQRRIDNAESLKEHADLEVELEITRRENLLEEEGLLQQERELIIEQSQLKIFEILQKYSKQQLDLDKKTAEAQRKIDEEKRKGFIGGIANVLGNAAVLFKKHTTAYKALASSETLINTYAAATAAYKSAAAIPYVGFILGPIAAATAVAAGIKNVAAINGTEIGGFIKGGLVKALEGINGFAKGGLSGTKVMSQHGAPVNRSNGDNRLVTVKTGEVILNESQQARLGGSDTFRKIGVPGFATGGVNIPTGFASNFENRKANNSINQSSDIQKLARAVNQVRTVLVLQEFEAAQLAKDEPIARAQVL